MQIDLVSGWWLPKAVNAAADRESGKVASLSTDETLNASTPSENASTWDSMPNRVRWVGRLSQDQWECNQEPWITGPNGLGGGKVSALDDEFH